MRTYCRMHLVQSCYFDIINRHFNVIYLYRLVYTYLLLKKAKINITDIIMTILKFYDMNISTCKRNRKQCRKVVYSIIYVGK